MYRDPYYYQTRSPYEGYGQPAQSTYHRPYEYSHEPPVNPAGMPYLDQTPYEQFEKPPLQFPWENDMPQAPYPNPPLKPAHGLMAHFQDENGQLDIDKMLSTVGQLANTYHQVYPIFKQIGGLLKFVNQRNS